ncbi:DEAD/DEAH box helicase [Chryseobacterium carnipullorum]|uniref:ATP-dependent RNA helicase rhlE n=1 Tax=Chryseobacterium carnipullorum TaxID=1124835 RepID=A0A1M7HB33_CHRCU|nr:DEAD/DEAH box helicase [Chryseobacterium carnipullorum]MDN5397622.1 DEAD/DEAH box helicase [Chryseobacterium sp.]AZA51080.1 DEAD/DEAH box helicase [Chryseobacterium carnipullorum]AZA65937.1 DEAD/DEAH box helicase [Chryseobacterium carnipullorum]MDN5479856.1 DEAD/DEAH box helicase [Chryseobacterium sp.]SHM25630.1 ATP-dependent RNA helicase RhlE [Chryseobacterium carnipullorum]
MSFRNLNLINPIVRAVTEAGYSKPTEIQYAAVPPILAGRDFIGYAQTGTGKTAAFAMPILQLLKRNTPDHKEIRTLILTPTRELVQQLEESFKVYSKYLPLSQLSIFGGVLSGSQLAALRKRVDILIATPERLLNLVSQRPIDLSKIEILVLDEADRMLDMGFAEDVKKILKLISQKRQTLFFSATMPSEVRKFADAMMNNPVEVTVDQIPSPLQCVNQSVYFVEKTKKTDLLINILQDVSILRSLVFTRTKQGADRLVKQLERTGIFAAAIHGNKSQIARQQAVEDFKNSKIRVLVATDIAARGIDMEELPYVVNYELPDVPETYVNRIERTGRAGTKGTAVSFCDEGERSDLSNIQKLIGFIMPVGKLHYIH